MKVMKVMTTFDRRMMRLDIEDHFSDRHEMCCGPDYDAKGDAEKLANAVVKYLKES